MIDRFVAWFRPLSHCAVAAYTVGSLSLAIGVGINVNVGTGFLVFGVAMILIAFVYAIEANV